MKILHTIDEPVPVRRDVYVIYKIGKCKHPDIVAITDECETEVTLSSFHNKDILLGNIAHKNGRQAIGWVYANDMTNMLFDGVSLKEVKQIANSVLYYQNWGKEEKGGQE
jgi:hypothetical protein